MWQNMFLDMKSMLSYQYLMRDMHIIKTWNVTMVTTQDTLYERKNNTLRNCIWVDIQSLKHSDLVQLNINVKCYQSTMVH